MPTPRDVTNEFSMALVEGRGAVFVGAGLSTPSGVPGWSDLLQGMAETRLGIQLNPDDNLPLIAQHIVNRTNNRAPSSPRIWPTGTPASATNFSIPANPSGSSI